MQEIFVYTPDANAAALPSNAHSGPQQPEGPVNDLTGPF